MIRNIALGLFVGLVCGASIAKCIRIIEEPTQAETRPVWRYWSQDVSIDEVDRTLAARGVEGWELVSVLALPPHTAPFHIVLYFKQRER